MGNKLRWKRLQENQFLLTNVGKKRVRKSNAWKKTSR